MREIKFRAWDDKAKKYLKVCRMGFNGFSHDFWSPSPVSCDARQADTTRYIFEQYTGLKDKNGREIYEGDIYFATYRAGGAGSIRGQRQERIKHAVEWSDRGSWRGKIIGDRRYNCCHPHNELGESVEIIGNIHKNPELLS